MLKKGETLRVNFLLLCVKHLILTVVGVFSVKVNMFQSLCFYQDPTAVNRTGGRKNWTQHVSSCVLCL